jgi:hypothetical protein
MSLLLLVDGQRPECVIAQPGRARTRLWAHVRATSLDRALATGASPDSTAALSLRAEQLIRAVEWQPVRAGTRRKLARLLRRLITEATRRRVPRAPRVPLCRRKILASRELLRELAERLASQEPVDARGVAQLRLLLIGVVGPLYDDPGADDLEPVLQAALEALDLSI